MKHEAAEDVLKRSASKISSENRVDRISTNCQVGQMSSDLQYLYFLLDGAQGELNSFKLTKFNE